MYTFVTLSLALGASALVVPRSSNSSSCSFELTASGGESGTIGQLSDGQNRIGGGLSPATFTIDNSGITDAAGRGCILTPSVEQFQCDQGVGPTYGFSIASNGSLEHAGSFVFYACPASDTEWNLYTTPVAGQLKCVEISLTASGCYSGCAASSAAPASTVTVTSISTTTVYDCTASSAAGVAPSTPGVVASSVTVVPIESSVPAQASTAPVVVASSVSVIQTTAPAEIIPAASSPAASVPAESTPVVESSQASVPLVATTGASAPVEVSSAVVESTTPIVQASSIVSVEQSSSVVVPAETTATVVPIEQTSSIYVQTSVPVEQTSSIYVQTSVAAGSPSAATPVQESTQVESSTIITPVQETTSVYSHSYVVPPVSSTSIITIPTTALTTSTPIATISSSRYYANTTFTSSPTTSTPVASSATSSASTCVATTLSTTYEGNYEYPHLIIPISSSTPSTAAGTQYFGTISSNVSTIFNFDIPSSYSGSTCNLIFLLPLQSELETSSYTFSGAGTVDFEQLSAVATEETDWDNAPSVEADLGTFTLTEGSSTLVKSFPCSDFAGSDVAFEMKSVDDTYLYFFQDWNPSPLGLYVTYC